MSNRKIWVEVAEIRQLTQKIREYVLRSADGSILPKYQPGAHIELHTVSAANGPIIRHYSLVGRTGAQADAANTYRIAVQREDRQRGSAHIHDTFQVGTSLEVSWPKNNFPLDLREQNTLLIAGGIGITPIFAMLRSVVRRARPFEIVYSGRTLDSMAYHEEVCQLGGAHAYIHLSGEDGSNLLDIRQLLARQPDGTNAYVCGPAAMIAATHAAAGEIGWNGSRVRSELFTAGPGANDQAFDVDLRKTGAVIRVGRDTTILDAISAAGIPVLSDCRRGECGLCPLRIIEADGAIQHRDRFLDEEQRAAGRELCICVSRINGSRLVLDA